MTSRIPLKVFTPRLQSAVLRFHVANGKPPNVIYLTDVDYEKLKVEWKNDQMYPSTAKLQYYTSFMGIEVRITDNPNSSVAYEQCL